LVWASSGSARRPSDILTYSGVDAVDIVVEVVVVDEVVSVVVSVVLVLVVMLVVVVVVVVVVVLVMVYSAWTEQPEFANEHTVQSGQSWTTSP